MADTRAEARAQADSNAQDAAKARREAIAAAAAQAASDKVAAREVQEREAIIAEAEAKADGLVPMSKDGARSYVHPTTVAAHVVAGWKMAAWSGLT